jgi:hypothetical protein
MRRGYRAIDLDTPEWSHWIDAAPDNDLTPRDGQDWVWREDRVRELLSRNDVDDLFISGCAENMGKLFDVIDTVVLLSAPLDTLMDRLAARATEGYGHTTDERRKVAELVATIEPGPKKKCRAHARSDAIDSKLPFLALEAGSEHRELSHDGRSYGTKSQLRGTTEWLKSERAFTQARACSSGRNPCG